MEITSLATAIASIAWPALAAVLLWRLFPIVREIANSRAFTVVFAGMQVSVQDASDQLRRQIEDLQNMVAELRAGQAMSATADPAQEPQPEAAPLADRTLTEQPDPPPSPPAAALGEAVRSLTPELLWVDDKPTGNAYEIARLREAGVEVSEVTTTDDALRLLTGGGRFNAVVTDMGRHEGLSYRSQAGLDLIRAARSARVSSPIFVYASRKAVDRTRGDVKLAGGNGATSSTVELFELLRGALGVGV